jgi:hypothetical protein
MLTAVPLPDQPLTVLWQSTLVDIEPGSRYGYRHDAAAINTTLAIANRTGAELRFPLILATTDPEDRDRTHQSVRVGRDAPALSEPADVEWDTLAASIRAQAASQGHASEWVEAYLGRLRAVLKRARKSQQIVLQPGEERFVRTHQRKLLTGREENRAFEFRGVFPLPQFALALGGSLSVAVALPRAVGRVPVDLVDWTRAFSPQAFGRDPGLPPVAGRYVVSWFWQNDPELYVSYRYAA